MIVKFNFISYKLIFLFMIAAASPTIASDWPSFNLLAADPTILPPPISLTVSQDPVYQAKKSYQGYPLIPILKSLTIPANYKAEELVIVFTAKDGYKVAMAYQDAYTEKALIAFRDKDAPGKENWIAFKFGSEMITPDPFYLVWPKRGLDKWRYPWPFQLTSISLRPATEYFGAATPRSGTTSVHQGFNLFSRYCIGCHSVNRVGGKVGPELNLPVSITEIYDDRKLSSYIRDAQSLRPGSKMPAFNKILETTEIDNIVKYLKQMQLEKNN